MATEKWRRRAVFTRSIGIRGNSQSQVPGAIVGLFNSYNGGGVGGTGVTAGTLGLSVNGTSLAGTVALLDMSPHRLRIPSAGRAIGGATNGFGTVANANGSAGDLVTGFDGASAYLGVNINGTFYVLQWPTNPTGAAGSVSVNPFAVGVA